MRRLTIEQYPLSDEEGKRLPIIAVFRPLSTVALDTTPEPLKTCIYCESFYAPIRYVAPPPGTEHINMEALGGMPLLYAIQSYTENLVEDDEESYLVITEKPSKGRNSYRVIMNTAVAMLLEMQAVPVGHPDLENIYHALSTGKVKDKKDLQRMRFHDPYVQSMVRSMVVPPPPAESKKTGPLTEEDYEKLVVHEDGAGGTSK